MPFLPYIFCQTVMLWITVAPTLMLLRSLRSLMTQGMEAAPIDYLLALTTEPLIMPARFLLGEAAESLPFDMPFLLTFILLPVVRALLPAVTLA